MQNDGRSCLNTLKISCPWVISILESLIKKNFIRSTQSMIFCRDMVDTKQKLTVPSEVGIVLVGNLNLNPNAHVL